MKHKTVYIMALKPKYAKAIYEGKKNWEFRKHPPPILTHVLIYESAPVSSVTGSVFFGVEMRSTASTVWDLVKSCKLFTKNLPGITRQELLDYAAGKHVSALRVIDLQRLEEPVVLKCKPPMNWGRYFVPKQEAEGSAE